MVKNWCFKLVHPWEIARTYNAIIWKQQLYILKMFVNPNNNMSDKAQNWKAQNFSGVRKFYIVTDSIAVQEYDLSEFEKLIMFLFPKFKYTFCRILITRAPDKAHLNPHRGRVVRCNVWYCNHKVESFSSKLLHWYCILIVVRILSKYDLVAKATRKKLTHLISF